MKTVSGDQRLLRRKGVYYYRRRVPSPLIDKFGKKFVQLSLHTTSFKEAKQLRTVKDLEWDARFEAANTETSPTADAPTPKTATSPLAQPELLRLIREYVERKDSEARSRFASNPPESEREKAEMIKEVG